MDLITRTSKKYYEELALQGDRQLYKSLFPEVDASDSSSFVLDSLIQDPYGVSYRNKDMQSALRAYKPGTGMSIDIPRTSEKTPISEDLLDKVAVGLESTAGFGANEARIIGNIVKQHISAHNMTKNKQAIDTLLTGKFEARGVANADLGLDIDYGRKTSLNLSYDFTGAGASFLEFLKNAQEELRANGTPLGSMAVILGDKYLTELSNDTVAQELMKNNSANQIVQAQMMPPMFNETEGLFVLGQIRGIGMLAPIWLLSYAPQVAFKSSPSATAEPFIPSDKAVFYSTQDTRYFVQRGMVVLDSQDKSSRVVGDVVFDSYTEKDPVTTLIRSQSRHAFTPANVNHTASTTGTFA